VILNFTLKPYVNHLGSSVSQPASRTQEWMLYWSKCIRWLPPCFAPLT
jgi:hypothetical protein